MPLMRLFPPPHEPKTGKRKQNKGKQPTTVLTINGGIELRRRWWHSPESGSEAPLDRWIMANGDNVTPGVREMCCRLNNDACNFDRAAENLFRTAQVQLSGELLRQIVEAEGRTVLQFHQRGQIDLGFTVDDCVVKPVPPSTPLPPLTPHRSADSLTPPPTANAKSVPPPVTRMYVGIDGVMVGLVTEAEKQKRREKVVLERRERQSNGQIPRPLKPRRTGADKSYKEFKAIRFYDEGNEHSHIDLSKCKRTQAAKILQRDSNRLGFPKATEKIALVDGASWIPPQLEDAELHLDGLCLDFYHLSENAHKTRRIVFGETEEGMQWVETFLHTLKHDGYEVAREQLINWRIGLRGRRRKAADRLLNYIVERRDMINYPEFAAKNWQIGSGPTEAACNTSTARLKRSGQKWDADNAEAVAAMTNLRDCNQWGAYWTSLPAKYTINPAGAKT